jgi:hypothetical protein
MPSRSVIVILPALLGLSCAAVVHPEEGERSGVQSWGFRTAYGTSDHSIRFVSVLPRVSLFLPRAIDQPLLAHDWQGEFVMEPVASYIGNSKDTFEVGANLLMLALRYDRGQPLVPFVEGGEGLLYTDLLGQRLGTRFQFSSQAGTGLHWFLDRTTALTASYRIRHISNAGISRQNSGLNTHFFTIGVSFFPKR